MLRDPNLARMLGFGFFSGLPLPLTIFTLQQWFTVSGIAVHTVGLVAWLGLPYTLKFCWAPLFDRRIGSLGRRRFWLLIVQPLLVCACVAEALTDPAQNAVPTAIAALAIAFFSASQDIVIDAWRIETFPEVEQGAALAAYVWGYRTAMQVSNAGAIALSVVVGWHVALLWVAALMAGAPLLTLFSPEPVVVLAPKPVALGAAIRASFIDPLTNLLRRRGAVLLLGAIILFRLGKVLADTTAASFYHQALGFGSGAVAAANFVPSLAGVYGGAAFGAWLVARLGAMRAMLVAGSMMAASLGLYILLLDIGGTPMLFLKVGGEFFAGTAADTAFLTFVSLLCAREYTATQYALLSSLAVIPLHTLAGGAGYLAEALGWRSFYFATMAASLPALFIMWHLRRGLDGGAQPARSAEIAAS